MQDTPFHKLISIFRLRLLVFNDKILMAAGHSAAKGKLIAVIGDEDTCTGFLLGKILN